MADLSQKHQAFFLAAWEGNIKSTITLLEKDIDANIQDNTRATALHYASYNGNNEIIELLISSGANANAQDTSGKTALFYASLNGHRHTVQLLLDKGADMNLYDENGRTPLLVAHSLGHTEIERLLRRCGAVEKVRVDQKTETQKELFTEEEIIKRQPAFEHPESATKSQKYCVNCNEWIVEPPVDSWKADWSYFHAGKCPQCRNLLTCESPLDLEDS